MVGTCVRLNGKAATIIGVVVSESLVRRHWPDGDPVGQPFAFLSKPNGGFHTDAVLSKCLKAQKLLIFKLLLS